MELNKLLYLVAFILFAISIITFILGAGGFSGQYGVYELFYISVFFLAPIGVIIWAIANIFTIKKKVELGIFGWIDTIFILAVTVIILIIIAWTLFGTVGYID